MAEAETMVERECLLFEAGEYPDRGVTITDSDLRAIAANTEGEVPVKVEHLAESPFDRALGVVTRLRAAGPKLWGVLRQPASAWEFVRVAGARSLSVALDTAAMRLREVSFVCRPRVATAQVFGGTAMLFERELRPEEVCEMTTVRQFAEGLIQYLRGATGAGDGAPDPPDIAAERMKLFAEREALRERRVEGEIARLKDRGLLRATDAAQGLARAILRFGDENVVRFGEEDVPVPVVFARFLEANGMVVPMGEIAHGDTSLSGRASERLISLAQEAARRDQVPYVQAFARVSGAHPDLARAAREEGMGG